MPRAPPSSAPVSDRAAADPARSGGADPMIRSVASVPTGATPMEKTTDPATTTPSPPAPPTWVWRPNRAAARPRPPAIPRPGRARRASTGVSIDPATSPQAEGSVHRPAWSGDRPRTSWRYWATNRKVPTVTTRLR